MFRCPKSVFITGANRGLGLEFVTQFLAGKPEAEHIIATHRSPLGSEGTKKLEDLALRYSNLHLVQLDIADDSSIQRAADEAKRILGENGLNLLINNGGMSDQTRTLADVTSESLMRHFRVNAVGPLMVLQKLQPLLEKAATVNRGQPLGIHRAAVVHMSSVMASIQLTGSATGAGNDAYRSSKAALNMLGHINAPSLKSVGILTIMLHPGWVQTDMGGEGAPLSTEESVSSVLRLLTTLNESHNGLFLGHRGEKLPW